MINNCKLTIIIAVFTISFIGYNILTVDADEEYDKKVCEDYNGEWKDTGGGDRGCKFEDTDDAERYGYRPGFSLSGTHSDAEYGIEDLVSYDEEGNKVYPKIPEYVLEEKESPKQICEDTSGEWKDGTCNFSKEEREHGYQEDFDHSMEEEGLWDNYALEQQSKEEAAQERKKMTQSKSFEKFVESKGIDIDDDYHWLSAQEQEEIETEFKEDKSDEYEAEINSKKEDVEEGKRYVNPDGGAPLYEDELTEDEKDYYEEYKPVM
jgi:hypothetical protein